MPNFDAEMRQVTLYIKPVAIPVYAEFVLFVVGITIDNLKHEVCEVVQFDLRKHV